MLKSEKDLLINLSNSFFQTLSKEAAKTARNVVKELLEQKTNHHHCTHPFVLLDEFLVYQELNGLIEFTLAQQDKFQPTSVLQRGKKEGIVDYRSRRSRVLYDLGKYETIIVNRILTYLPYILNKLGHAIFPVSKVETQLTASNDCEYFRLHNDNSHEILRSREITFVYYFYREPKCFTGGELKLYDSNFKSNQLNRSCKKIEPQQNQILFFPSNLMHEVMQVNCPSHQFADSRFTINGWIHK